jgi:type II secretory pathway component PulJ
MVKNSSGFLLLELCIALVLFAVVSLQFSYWVAHSIEQRKMALDRFKLISTVHSFIEYSQIDPAQLARKRTVIDGVVIDLDSSILEELSYMLLTIKARYNSINTVIYAGMGF